MGARLLVLVRGQTWSLGWKITNQSQNAPSPFQCLESYSGTAKFTITSSRTEVKERERRSYRQDQRLSTALLYLTGHNPSICDGLQVAPCGDWACKRPGGVGSRIGVENFSPSTALRSHPSHPSLQTWLLLVLAFPHADADADDALFLSLASPPRKPCRARLSAEWVRIQSN